MSDFQVALTNTAGVSSVVSFWVYVASNASKRLKDLAVKLAEIVLIVGFVALTIAIITRGVEAQRFPLANLYESLLWFAWATMGGFIYVSRAYGIHQLGWLASLTAATFFIYGSWLPASQHEITPLVPALVSYWRQIHVPPLIVSYAMFFLAGLSGLLQLYKAGRHVSLGLSVVTIIAACSAIGLGTYTETDTHWLQLLFVGSSILGTILSWRFVGMTDPKLAAAPEALQTANKKASEMYDDVGFRCVSIGFPLLTIGIITGGLWANHAWGSYWSWDPKESMALVTWLSYAAYIHLRVQRDLSAEKLSIVSVLGLLLTLLTYLGFNSLGFGGLHSYGKFKP